MINNVSNEDRCILVVLFILKTIATAAEDIFCSLDRSDWQIWELVATGWSSDDLSSAAQLTTNISGGRNKMDD